MPSAASPVAREWAIDFLGVQALWDAGLSGAGITIGTLDSGIEAGHPAFAGCPIHFRRFDRRGIVVEGAPQSDLHGHGTSTTSVITRMAPRATLYVAAVLEEGDVVARVLCGLQWFLECGVRVVCVPLGVPSNPIFLGALRALQRQGTFIVAATGNRGAGRGLSPGDYTEILAVGACDVSGKVPGFSGSAHITGHTECFKPDLLAPGVDVLAASRSGTVATVSGTSVACASVAGIAALLLEAVPDAAAVAVERALVDTALPLPAGAGCRARHGAVQPAAALARLRASRTGERQQPSPLHDPLAPPNKFVDSRLRDACRYASDRDVLSAVVAVSGAGNSWMPPLEPFRPDVRVILPATTAIVRGPVTALRRLIDHPAVRAASAADIDRCSW